MQEGNKAKENSGELYSVVQMRRFNIPIEGSRAAHSKLHKSRLSGGQLVKKLEEGELHFGGFGGACKRRERETSSFLPPHSWEFQQLFLLLFSFVRVRRQNAAAASSRTSETALHDLWSHYTQRRTGPKRMFDFPPPFLVLPLPLSLKEKESRL